MVGEDEVYMYTDSFVHCIYLTVFPSCTSIILCTLLNSIVLILLTCQTVSATYTVIVGLIYRKKEQKLWSDVVDAGRVVNAHACPSNF